MTALHYLAAFAAMALWWSIWTGLLPAAIARMMG